MTGFIFYVLNKYFKKKIREKYFLNIHAGTEK